MEMKTKINEWELIKHTSFCTTKETISNVKMQPSERERIMTNETSGKELIYNMYKQLMQLNTRKTNKQKNNNKKNRPKNQRHFSKEDILMD